MNKNIFPQISKTKFSIFISMMVILVFASCEKTIYLKFGEDNIKQVILSNFTAKEYLKVNISTSKQPDNFNPIDFLSDCKVDLYEDGIFRETMPFILKDTLSGLGYYTSTFKLTADKTYKIISTHPNLPTAEASEYLPIRIDSVPFNLLQHADSTNPSMLGKYTIRLKDNELLKNYYYLSTSYILLTPTVNDIGDTIYKSMRTWDLPNYNIDFPTNNHSNPSLFTDSTFNGQEKAITVSFQSRYSNYYKEISLVVELSNLGKNFYDWRVQQIKPKTDYLNEGPMERINLKSNIINGFGHFSAYNSSYITIRIK